MQNGETGSITYWDDSYSGTGSVTTSLAPLSGGTGDLTDGVIATENWNVTPGPYVGWRSIDPVITFAFVRAYSFTAATFHFDDSNGGGGVNPPRSIAVNGISAAITDLPGGAPYSETLDLTGLSPTDTLEAQFFRTSGFWIMLSEVTFEVSDPAPVPVPAAGVLLLGALGGLAALRRRSAARPARGARPRRPPPPAAGPRPGGRPRCHALPDCSALSSRRYSARGAVRRGPGHSKDSSLPRDRGPAPHCAP
jgi:hypothetical protein